MGDFLGMGKVTDKTMEAAKAVYPDLFQPATKQAGKALETVFELGNTILLPIKLLNEKARLNFEKHMKKYEEKINEIPQENVTSVLPDIGLPIIDRLTYLTNEEIADLFINFLVSASIDNTVSQAHPRFINILNSISVDEARLIKYFYEKPISYIPVIDYDLNIEESGIMYPPRTEASITIIENGNNLKNEIELISDENINLYLNNLESLGILIKTTEKHIVKALDVYEMIDEMNWNKAEEIKEERLFDLRDQYPNQNSNISKRYGFYELTSLGETFVSICNNQ